MTRRPLQLVVIVALLLCGPARAVDRQRVAVLELQGPLASDIQALLTDTVRKTAVDLLPADSYLVLSRENLAAILGDMGIDANCVEGECEVETGRNLGAAFVASGAVVELDGVLLATLKLFATADGAILASEEARAGRALELIDALKPAASRLFAAGLAVAQPVDGRIGEVGKSVDLGGGRRAVVSFESIPPGAVVLVDGGLVCPSTPCTREVGVGPRRVEMQLEQHRAAELSFDPARRTSVSLELSPRFATLTVRREPRGLAFTIDGERPEGEGPFRVAPGTHEVVAADRCFLAQGERVTLEEGGSRTVSLRPETRNAGLAVSVADPDGNALAAAVTVDGEARGTSPLRVEVPLCSQTIAVSFAGSETLRQGLALVEGEVAEVRAVLGTGGQPGATSHPAASAGRRDRPQFPVYTTKTHSRRLHGTRGFKVRQVDERIVLDGRKRTAVLGIEVQSPPGEAARETQLEIASSVGRISLVQWNEHTSLFEVELELPSKSFPRLALLSIWDAGDAVNTTSFAALKLWGAVSYPVETRRPGVKIGLAVRGRSYGPVTADASGRASVPIEVAPGESHAQATLIEASGARSNQRLDLQTPPFSRIVLGPARWQDGHVEVVVFARDPTGDAASVETPRVEVDGCSNSGLAVDDNAAGTWEIVCPASSLAAEGGTVRAWLPGLERHAVEAVIEVAP